MGQSIGAKSFSLKVMMVGMFSVSRPKKKLTQKQLASCCFPPTRKGKSSSLAGAANTMRQQLPISKVHQQKSCLVFVHCWEDPRDFNVVLGGGSGGGSSDDQSQYDPWFPNYVQLMFCQGVNDLFDTNGGPADTTSTSMAHPNYEACVNWEKYLEDCILLTQPDMSDINNPNYTEMMMEWAHLQWSNEDAFNEIVGGSACVPTEDLENYVPEITEEDCFNSLVALMGAYGLELTRPEQDAVLGNIETGACGNQEYFNQLALFEYFNVVNAQFSVEPSLDFAKAKFIQTLSEGSANYFDYLKNNIETTNVLIEFILDTGINQQSQNLLKILAAEYEDGLNTLVFNTLERRTFIESHSSFYEDAYIEDTGLPCCSGAPILPPNALNHISDWHSRRFSEEVARLKATDPDYYIGGYSASLRLRLHAEYAVLAGTIHFALDVIGLVPLFGIPADAVNFVFYAIEGEGLEATLSAMAMIPVVGEWAATVKYYDAILSVLRPAGTTIARKVGAKVVNENGVEVVKFHPVWNANKSWKEWWGFEGDVVGHYMIPKSLAKDNPVLQKAARASDGNVFHPHDIDNGFALALNIHTQGHTTYTTSIRNKLVEWNNVTANRNLSPETTASIIKRWQDLIRERLSDPNLTALGDLDIPDLPSP